jgi:AraC family transcriptional regulator
VEFQTFEEYEKQIQIKELGDFRVIYERHLDNYNEIGRNLDEFTKKYKSYYNENTLLMEKFYDDPTVTGIDQCLYDICMTVNNDCSLDNVTTIQGGKFAVYRFDGSVKDIFAAFQGVFRIWLANSGYEMDERYGFDIYRNIDRENMHVVMDLCIPVK